VCARRERERERREGDWFVVGFLEELRRIEQKE